MERSRPAPALSAEEVLFLPAPLDVLDPVPPTTPSPRERLNAVRAVVVGESEVTSLVDGLALPLVAGETPRHRADLLLEVLEDEDLCGRTTRAGLRVGSAALEALHVLGFPYALEVSPSMLERARETATTRHTSLLGAGLALGSVLSVALAHGDWWKVHPVTMGVVSGLFLAPALGAALSRELGSRFAPRFFRRVHGFFNGVQWFVGVLSLIALDSGLAWSSLLPITAQLSAWTLREGPPERRTE